MRSFLLLSLITFTCSIGFGQQHTRCDSGVEFLVGATRFGEYSKVGVAHVGFVKYFSDRLYGKIDLFVSRELYRGLPHRVFGADITAGFTLFQLNDSWYFNLIGGITGSKEFYLFKEKYDLNKYGVLAGGELEHYFSKRLSVLLNVQERFLVGENKLTTRGDIIWGKIRWYASLGVRFHFYNSRCRPNKLQRSN